MKSLEHAVQLFRAGRVAEAEAACRAFRKKAPKHPGALHLEGVCAASRGAVREAAELLEKAAALAPAYMEAQHDLGRVYVQAGRAGDAERVFRRSITRFPASPSAYDALGVLLTRARRFDEAIELLVTAVGLDASEPFARKHLGDAYWDAGREAEALPHHEAAFDQWYGPPDPVFFEHLWQQATAAGKAERARAVLERWLEGRPDDAVARHLHAAASGDAVPSRASDGYVERTFDAFAETFEQQLASLGYRTHTLVAEALRRAHPGVAERALDAGCGTGLCGPLLRPLARRLIGVDLSRAMLERASCAGHYDELVHLELSRYLGEHEGEFDWIVSADTLCYFGDLDEVSGRLARALRPDGHVVFSVERLADASPSETFALQAHGRYAHRPAYVERAIQGAGLSLVELAHETLRHEKGQPVAGMVVVAAR